jgi:hypothetical protein
MTVKPVVFDESVGHLEATSITLPTINVIENDPEHPLTEIGQVICSRVDSYEIKCNHLESDFADITEYGNIQCHDIDFTGTITTSTGHGTIEGVDEMNVKKLVVESANQMYKTDIDMKADVPVISFTKIVTSPGPNPVTTINNLCNIDESGLATPKVMTSNVTMEGNGTDYLTAQMDSQNNFLIGTVHRNNTDPEHPVDEIQSYMNNNGINTKGYLKSDGYLWVKDTNNYSTFDGSVYVKKLLDVGDNVIDSKLELYKGSILMENCGGSTIGGGHYLSFNQNLTNVNIADNTGIKFNRLMSTGERCDYYLVPHEVGLDLYDWWPTQGSGQMPSGWAECQHVLGIEHVHNASPVTARPIYICPLVSGTGTDLVRGSDGYIKLKSSTASVKHNIEPETISHNWLKQLQPIKFNWNFDDQPDTGLLAEDVYDVNPYACLFDIPKKACTCTGVSLWETKCANENCQFYFPEKSHVIGIDWQKITLALLKDYQERNTQN